MPMKNKKEIMLDRRIAHETDILNDQGYRDGNERVIQEQKKKLKELNRELEKERENGEQ